MFDHAVVPNNGHDGQVVVNGQQSAARRYSLRVHSVDHATVLVDSARRALADYTRLSPRPSL